MNTAAAIFLYLFEEIVIFDYFNAFFCCRKNKWGTLAAFSAGAALQGALFFPDKMVLNFVLFMAVNVLLLHFCYQVKLKIAFFQCLLLSVFIYVSGMIVSSSMHLVAAKPDFGTDSSRMLLLSALSKLLFFVFCQIAKHFAVREEEQSRLPIKSLWLYMLPACSLLLLYYGYALSLQTQTPYLQHVLLAGSLLLLFSNILVFMVYENLVKTIHAVTKLQLERQKDKIEHAYTGILQSQNENSRRLIHDIKNHLAAIEILAEKGDTEKIKNYIASIDKSYQLPTQAVAQTGSILNAICSYKQEQCEKENISFTVQNTGADFAFLDDADLCTVLTNLLDNAMEASRVSQEKKVSVLFSARKNCFQTMNVCNSCDRPPLLFGRCLISRKKGSGHGLGMRSIETVVKKYSGVLDYRYDDKKRVFHANVLFPQPASFAHKTALAASGKKTKAVK